MEIIYVNFRLINEFESDLCSDEYKLNSSEIKASLSIVHYYNNFLNHIHSLIHNSLQTLLVMTDSPPSFPSENYVNPPPPLKSSSLAQVLNNDWSIKMALDSCVEIFINWKWWIFVGFQFVVLILRRTYFCYSGPLQNSPKLKQTRFLCYMLHILLITLLELVINSM